MSKEKMMLKLYISGITPENQDSILKFKKLLQEKCGDHYSLEVIDVFDHPELAESEKIIATPTLLRSLPIPVQKIIMDFSDHKKLLFGIDLIINK